jgi:hypothetical protein
VLRALRPQATALPVTAGQWHNTLLGEVAGSDVLLAIQDRQRERPLPHALRRCHYLPLNITRLPCLRHCRRLPSR